MAKFRKKPVVIEAVRWDGNAIVGNVPEWILKAIHGPGAPDTTPGTAFRVGNEVHIGTLEGVMIASPGDWIIQGVLGEIYPCKPDIFALTYEPAEEPANG